jgi:hypothetical protein
MFGDRLKIKRDLRVDFVRGLALLTIFIDHVPGNRWAAVTQQNFGFSDAAEMFVILAGFSAVLAYGRYLNGDQLSVGIRRIVSRVGTIYLFHIATLGVVGIILAALAGLPGSAEYVRSMMFEGLMAGDPSAIIGALLLVEQPKYFDILPLYVVLLAAFPLLYLMLRRSLLGGIAASAALWLLVQFTDVNLLKADGSGWHFNPFAWQLLLVVGMASALQVRRGGVPRSAVLIALAAAVLAISFVLRAPWTHWPLHIDATPVDLKPYGAFMLKTSLGPARLIHILAVGYLLLVLVPARANWLKNPAARVVADAGSNSLEVFCLGVIFSVIGGAIISAFGGGAIVESWITTVGVAALLFVGLAVARNVRARKRARSRIQKVEPQDAFARA